MDPEWKETLHTLVSLEHAIVDLDQSLWIRVCRICPMLPNFEHYNIIFCFLGLYYLVYWDGFS